MANETLTVWTCDLCAAQDHTGERTPPPKSWARIDVGGANGDLDICPGCVKLIRKAQPAFCPRCVGVMRKEENGTNPEEPDVTDALVIALTQLRDACMRADAAEELSEHVDGSYLDRATAAIRKAGGA